MSAGVGRRALAIGCTVALCTAGCGFQGINSLPLPGTVGRGKGAITYHIEVENVGALVANSPVMMADVVIGSIVKMQVQGWHADVEVSVQPDVVVPANAVATVGQTSLLGSMHLQLNAPLGQPPTGQLPPNSTLGLDRASIFPSTEQTLSSLSTVLNSGGLGQIGDIIHNAGAMLSGHEREFRDLLTRLDTIIGVLDSQRDNFTDSVRELNRITETFAEQRDELTAALRDIPPALEVLNRERPLITTALDKLRVFSDTATGVINDTEADLVTNLQNIGPAMKALADVGPDLDKALQYAFTFPYGQEFVDRAIKGDYVNIFVEFDLTVPRLKRTLLLGTRWGQEGAQLVPAPGEPWYLQYTYDPLSSPLTAPPEDAPPPDAPPPPVTDPVLPVAPQPSMPQAAVPPTQPAPPIFAGPYEQKPPPSPDGAPAPSGGS